jgi:hypothetical protein
MDLFNDTDEQEEVDALQTWWNRYAFTSRSSLLCRTHISLFYSQIFPSYLSARRSICKHSALARIREKWLELKAITGDVILPDSHVSM